MMLQDSDHETQTDRQTQRLNSLELNLKPLTSTISKPHFAPTWNACHTHSPLVSPITVLLVPELPWSCSCQHHHGPAGTLDNLICRRFTLFKLRSPTQTSDRCICRRLSIMRERKNTRSRIPKYPTTNFSEIRGSSRCWRKLGLTDPSS